MIYAMQVYNLSAVNRVLVNDCLSSVPITSWPLMFANSGLAACYIREVRGDTQGAFTGTWPQQRQLSSASVCWPLCTAVLYKKRRSMRSVGEDTLHWPGSGFGSVVTGDTNRMSQPRPVSALCKHDRTGAQVSGYRIDPDLHGKQ